MTGESPCFEAKSAIYKTDGITEKVKITNHQFLTNPQFSQLHLFHCTNIEDLDQTVRKMIHHVGKEGEI